MNVIIDRFEGDNAIVEISINHYVTVPKILFPNAKEGDVIKIQIDDNETKKRKIKIENLMNNLFED